MNTLLRFFKLTTKIVGDKILLLMLITGLSGTSCIGPQDSDSGTHCDCISVVTDDENAVCSNTPIEWGCEDNVQVFYPGHGVSALCFSKEPDDETLCLKPYRQSNCSTPCFLSDGGLGEDV